MINDSVGQARATHYTDKNYRLRWPSSHRERGLSTDPSGIVELGFRQHITLEEVDECEVGGRHCFEMLIFLLERLQVLNCLHFFFIVFWREKDSERRIAISSTVARPTEVLEHCGVRESAFPHHVAWIVVLGYKICPIRSDGVKGCPRLPYQILWS